MPYDYAKEGRYRRASIRDLPKVHGSATMI